ncbi:MAG TPA: isocitrate lyase/phosphoenolpyruvate mutase family protein [Thermoanaerobaculia bacterium]|nr:isocitrate lyase/phosphoenolpyruvate mutase family protein [Thermoanaerobaculia bacterium]
MNFKELHEGPHILILPNAWDAVSARIVVNAGAKAVATSSAAVAWAHGYADGNALPVPLLLATLRDITRVVNVPVTADIEAGYSDDPDDVGKTVRALLDAGVAGINLEDGGGSPDLLCAKIEAARRAGPIFINARTDMFLRKQDNALDESIARAKRYTDAGADGIFVPGVTDAAQIETIVRSIALPLNVMARPGVPPAAELQRIGVRRLSGAAWLARAALKSLHDTAAEFLAHGDSDALAAKATPIADYNGMFSG